MEMKKQILDSSEPEICRKIMAVTPCSKLMFNWKQTKVTAEISSIYFVKKMSGIQQSLTFPFPPKTVFGVEKY
jgi:hypothetical protein